jgi:hypothetical protein
MSLVTGCKAGGYTVEGIRGKASGHEIRDDLFSKFLSFVSLDFPIGKIWEKGGTRGESIIS